MKNRTTLVLLILSLAANVFLYFDKCQGTTDEKLTEAPAPAQTISIEDARILTQHYVDGRYQIINDSLFKDSRYKDTRDFYFPLDTIKKYIRYVEAESKERGYTNLGLRIYNAAYPMDSPNPKADKGFSTVIIVPTHDSPKLQQGFFPMPQQNTDDINPLNYGQGGHPPNGL